MEDSVGIYDSIENRIDSLIDLISQYRDMFKAEEENQKSALSEKMKNLEEENRRLMEENKELVEKGVYWSLKAQTNTEWMKKMSSELEMKEQEVISLTAEKNEDVVALKKAYRKMNTDWQYMERELFLIKSYHKDTVAQMEAEWEKVMETLTISHESTLSHVCSQIQALHKDVELHERDAAEATKQLQEKEATIHAMETMYGDLQKQHLTLTNVEKNQQRQMDLLAKENAELKEFALMTDKQKAKKLKEKDNADSCSAWCKV